MGLGRILFDILGIGRSAGRIYSQDMEAVGKKSGRLVLWGFVGGIILTCAFIAWFQQPDAGATENQVTVAGSENSLQQGGGLELLGAKRTEKKKKQPVELDGYTVTNEKPGGGNAHQWMIQDEASGMSATIQLKLKGDRWYLAQVDVKTIQELRFDCPGESIDRNRSVDLHYGAGFWSSDKGIALRSWTHVVQTLRNDPELLQLQSNPAVGGCNLHNSIEEVTARAQKQGLALLEKLAVELDAKRLLYE